MFITTCPPLEALTEIGLQKLTILVCDTLFSA
jgi:hypothetical protein